MLGINERYNNEYNDDTNNKDNEKLDIFETKTLNKENDLDPQNILQHTVSSFKLDEEIKSETKDVLEKINDAKWLLTSVKKRNETVQKVGKYICLKQIAFFDNNPLKINALSNKEIADEIGVHPSTVSRILRNKYIDTPKGIMPMKSLLISSVSRIRDVSVAQLMKLIQDIVNSEKKPKSDKKIAIELNKRGFGLARRTISKYRKKNNIF